ncbi:hypothetical protein ACFFTM_22610 [Pseudoduganella plicata]|uniref:Uncharacterized protein n=1 Tax=Pseudoduganella plicata TaxID=321984 RepID=A0A4P7BDW7_9BURK|nr:hypothetical protein [Pseudoduganella plicata]QBQ36282.1 hypothetical protein E1742_09025 [Pseudoduganella plicata]GGY76385.1 hypothetical protein GCM10007388_06330 [Pseudoduganella plicata]
MTPSDNSRKTHSSEETFVLVDTEHPGIGNIDLPETEVRRVDKPIPGNRQSTDQGARQGEQPGTGGGAPGPESSSGV